MSRLDRRSALATIGAGLLAGCTTDTEVVENTRPPAEGGIGGTGIIGTLTGFGSLLVNGLRIELPDGLKVSSALGALDPDDLTVGHLLTIEAETRDGTLLARRVDLAYPVIGQVEATSAAGNMFRVAGVSVELEAGMGPAPIAGQHVAVSGAWNNGRVIASAVEVIAPQARAVLSGTLRREGTRWSVGGQPVTLPADATPEPESFATVFGTPGGTGFQVEELQAGRFTGAAGPLVRLSVEGYLVPTPAAPFHTVDGLGHSFSPDSKLGPFIGSRALFEGGYDGKFRLAQATALPEALDARRTILQALDRKRSPRETRGPVERDMCVTTPQC